MPIPISSIGERVPDVTSPPSTIGMPCRGIAFSSITNETSLREGPSSLIRRSSSTPVNSLSSAVAQPKPAEIIRLRGDVVSVQRQRRLRPERVACTKAGGLRAALEDQVHSATASSAGTISSAPSSPV